jgi:hypothetical protein
MSSCSRRFWGSGTPSTRPDTSEQSKEMNAKLADLIAARNKQDERFTGFPKEEPPTLEKNIKPPNK